MVILSLPLIQEGQLSVTGERMGTLTTILFADDLKVFSRSVYFIPYDNLFFFLPGILKYSSVGHKTKRHDT